MAEYRIYKLIDGGHINEPPRAANHEDDAAAIAHAKQTMDGHDVQIWFGERLVETIEWRTQRAHLMKENRDVDTLKAGERVSRIDNDELGTVVEADGEIKVKWDSGRTSYFRRGERVNVRLSEQDE